MDASAALNTEAALREIRRQLTVRIEALRDEGVASTDSVLGAWTFHMALIEQFRLALSRVDMSLADIDGPDGFPASVADHLEELLDILGGEEMSDHEQDLDGDLEAAQADRSGPYGLSTSVTKAASADHPLTSGMRDLDINSSAVPSESQLQSYDLVVRSLFDVLAEASRRTASRRNKAWLCPLHAQPTFPSADALKMHLLDGAHGISEEQAGILLGHAVTTSTDEVEDTWETTCDANMLKSNSVVLQALTAVAADFRIAADYVDQVIKIRRKRLRSDRDAPLKHLATLQMSLLDRCVQCRQRFYNLHRLLGLAFERGDTVAVRDLHDAELRLRRALSPISRLDGHGEYDWVDLQTAIDIEWTAVSGALENLRDRILVHTEAPSIERLSIAQSTSSRETELQLSIAKLNTRTNALPGPIPVTVTNHSKSKSGRSTRSVASSASTVFSKASSGVSSATSMGSDDEWSFRSRRSVRSQIRDDIAERPRRRPSPAPRIVQYQPIDYADARSRTPPSYRHRRRTPSPPLYDDHRRNPFESRYRYPSYDSRYAGPEHDLARYEEADRYTSSFSRAFGSRHADPSYNSRYADAERDVSRYGEVDRYASSFRRGSYPRRHSADLYSMDPDSDARLRSSDTVLHVTDNKEAESASTTTIAKSRNTSRPEHAPRERERHGDYVVVELRALEQEREEAQSRRRLRADAEKRTLQKGEPDVVQSLEKSRREAEALEKGRLESREGRKEFWR